MRKIFYVLESVNKPGMYYIDNQFGLTNDALRAERYSSKEKALEYWTDPTIWIVREVSIEIK